MILHPLRQCWNVGFRSPEDADTSERADKSPKRRRGSDGLDRERRIDGDRDYV